MDHESHIYLRVGMKISSIYRGSSDMNNVREGDEAQFPGRNANTNGPSMRADFTAKS